MGAYEVVLADPINRDLERIVRYIARDNPEGAQRFAEKLVKRAFDLSKPHVCQNGGWVPQRPGLRKLVEGNYLILYRIFPEKNQVRVLRFWHGAQDRARL